MKTNSISTTIATVAFTLLTVSFVSAQERERKEPPSAEDIIKKMDSDEDGKLSKKEVNGPLKNDFAKVDTDEDGYLTLEELENAPRPKKREKN
ncbi:EF hand domain-containing protein [Flavobacteriaceae bacterium MAR_2009_75]|nr:EF hand domain-containing protein [Flavobacteriaceae bacterium MAR_2009_75]